MKRMQKIVDKKAIEVNVDLDDIKKQCEKTGVSADSLTTCSKTATFVQCVFVKIRNRIVDHRQQNAYTDGANNTTDTNANVNSSPMADANVDKPKAETID